MGLRTVIIRSNQICPDSRVEKEAAALAEYGHDVTILAWDRRDNVRIKNETINPFGYEIPIVRFGHKAVFGGGFKSLRPYLGFQWSQFKWLIKHRKQFDVIHACDFDTAFTSSIANIFLRKKYIFDIFDYIAGERKTVFQKILCKLQDWIINRSTATIICTEERRKQIAFAKPQKLVVVHNSPPKLDFETIKEKRVDGPIKVCYVGILQDYRLLKELPAFFIKHSDFELHIGGFGKYEEYYKDLSQKYNNIIYYGRLEYRKTLELEKNCDIMLAIYDPEIENHIFAAPNKFYEGLMIGKPLIMVKGTGMSSIVEEHGVGETIDYSIEGFETGILRLADKRSEWNDVSAKMNLIYKDYSWDEMKSRLIKLYGEI